jgi:hypothetical protein
MPKYKLVYKVYGKRQVLDFEELSEALKVSVDMFRTLSGSHQCIMVNTSVVMDKEDLINEWIASRGQSSDAEDSGGLSNESSKIRYAGKV